MQEDTIDPETWKLEYVSLIVFPSRHQRNVRIQKISYLDSKNDKFKRKLKYNERIPRQSFFIQLGIESTY